MKKLNRSFLRACAILLTTPFLIMGCHESVAEEPVSWSKLPQEASVKMYALMSEMVQISPRESNTINAAKASRWIAQKIQSFGFEPKADTWSENTAFGRKTFSNIYVDIPGATSNIIMFASHYDTKAGISDTFQGANDSGSSTGVLLGLLEHFALTKPKLQHTIRFSFFDGEECYGDTYLENDGLHGSRRMAKQMHESRKQSPLIAMILLDMIGDENLKIEIPRNVTPWLATVAIQAANKLKHGPRVLLGDISIIDDHIPFLINNFSAITIIDFDYGSAPGKHDYWHTVHDTVDKISAASLFKAGNLALKMLEMIEAGQSVPDALKLKQLEKQ